MSSLLQVRNVPDQVRRGLKARAAAEGQSLNTFLLQLLDREMATPTVAEVFERAQDRADRASASAVDVVAAARGERDEQLTRPSR